MYSCVLLELSREVHGTSRLIDRASRSEYGLFQGRTRATSGPLASGWAAGDGVWPVGDSDYSARWDLAHLCTLQYSIVYTCMRTRPRKKSTDHT